MRVRVYEAGKPKDKRKVDVEVDLGAVPVTFGGGGDCKVKLPEMEEDEVRAELRIEAGRCLLKNLSEEAALTVGGKEVAPGDEVALKGAVLLDFDGYELACEIDEVALARLASERGGEAIKDSLDLAVQDVLKNVYDALGVPEDRPTLVVYDRGNQVSKRLELGPEDTEITIGRHPTNRLVLYHATVSKQHARVVRDALGFTIQDMGSRNGLEVNGHRVEGNHRLKSGDRIQIGCFSVAYFDPQVIIQDLQGPKGKDDGKGKGGKGGRVVVGTPADAGAEDDTLAPEAVTGPVKPLPREAGGTREKGKERDKDKGKDRDKGKGKEGEKDRAAAEKDAKADAAKKKGGGGGGLVIYLLVGLGVLLLLGAIAGIVYLVVKG